MTHTTTTGATTATTATAAADTVRNAAQTVHLVVQPRVEVTAGEHLYHHGGLGLSPKGLGKGWRGGGVEGEAWDKCAGCSFSKAAGRDRVLGR
jgi:hypothetical protein